MISLKVFFMPLSTLLLGFLPLPVSRFITRLFVFIYYLTHPERQRIIADNLYHILGELDNKVLKKYMFQTFDDFGQCILDLLRVPLLKRRDFLSMIAFRGVGEMDRALSLRKGAIMVSSHIGAPEFAGCFLSILGYPFSTVIEPIGRGISKIYNVYRSYTGMEMIFLDQPIEMLRALRRRRILTLVADRDLTGTGKKVRFFNSFRYIASGPARLLSRTEAPLLFGYMVYQRKGKKSYWGVIERVPYEGKNEEEISQLLADKFCEIIREYPTQWFVFQPEWQS